MSNNILTSANKSFRIFRILDKDDSYLERNVKLKRPSGICFMPFVSTRAELADLVQKFFGYKGYQQLLQNYYFNYKFVYQPALLPGRKIIMQNRSKIIRNEALSYLPNLRKQPIHKVFSNKNAIIDYTDQYALMCPKQEMLQKQPVLKYCEYIFPEMMTRFGIAYEKPELFKWTSRYVSSQVKPYLYSNFSYIIIPIEVNITNTSLVNLYIDYFKNIPLGIKRNINNLKFLSLIRMIYRAYANDIQDISSDEYKYFLTELVNHNVIFFFYNKRFSFTVNFTDLRERNINTRQFRNMFKSRLISLISNNIGLASDESMDAIISEDLEEDEEKPTEVSKDVNLTIDKDTKVKSKEVTEKEESNGDIVDNTKEKRDEKINKILKQSIVKRKNYEIDIKKKTDKLLESIDKMKEDTPDIELFENMTSEIEDKIEPEEDRLEKRRLEIEKLQKKALKETSYTKIKGIDLIESAKQNVSKPIVDDSDFEQIETEEDIEEKEDEKYDENGFLIEEENDETVEEDYLDELSDEVVEINKRVPITVSSDGNISDEEKKELLKEINKRQQPKKSEKQLRRIELVKDKYKSIKLEDNRTIDELIEDINSNQIVPTVKNCKTVIDKSVESCNLQDFEKSYIKNTMQSDIIKVLKSFDDENKSIPMHIIDYKEEDTSDRFNSKKTITCIYEDDNQKRHTIKFDIPVPMNDGILLINGNKKVLKKQITLRPIVKINPSRLAITTFYNKVLMFRQGTILNRKVVVLKKIIDNVLEKHENTFKYYYGNNLKMNKNFLTSIEYDELAKIYHKFMVGKSGNRTVIFFNQPEIRDEIKKLNIPYVYHVSKLPIAIDYAKKEVIEFDMNSINTSVIDVILDIIYEKSYYPEIDEIKRSVKAPKRRIYSRITIQSFDVPLITFLSALFGLSNIIRLSGLKYKFTNQKLEEDAPEREWLTVKFKDGTLYYPEYPYANSLLFNGLNEMITEEYYFDQFDEVLPYMDYCAKILKTRNVFKGWIAFKELFIDAITKEILEQEKLPTDFLELFLYANDLLIDNSYSNETEAKSYRIRSFELLALSLYKNISNEYRKYIQKEGRANVSITIPQTCIMTALTESQILETYDTINPINELKMKSGCTVKGNGLAGANTKHGYGMDRRGFGEDAIGIYAESNVDNHNVGIVKELTTNTKIINTRGFLDTNTDPKAINKLTASQRMSPEELIMPAIVKYDSPNRVAFSSAQWKHTMPIVGGGDPPFVGSGYEKTVVGDIGDTYALKAEKDCTIDTIDDELKIITVINKDGTKQSYRYETQYLKNGNIELENNLVLNVKEGQKLKANDVLAYSDEFFTKTETGELIFTMGCMGRVALMDDYFTEEDSSLVSETLSKKMSSSITHKKTISISGKSNIIKIVELGSHVKEGEPLMLFEDERDEEVSNVDVNAILDMLGDADESAIEKMSYHAPKANGTGEITKIDVYWTGDFEDMSPSVKKLVNSYIKDKKEKIKYEEEMTGVKNTKAELELKKSIPQYGKLNGVDIDENNGIIIDIYITHVLPYGPGDKLSFYPAIKSVTPQVVSKELSPYCESGNVDAVLGLISMSARQVNSPYFLGTLGKILYDMSKRISGEYLGKE